VVVVDIESAPDRATSLIRTVDVDAKTDSLDACSAAVSTSLAASVVTSAETDSEVASVLLTETSATVSVVTGAAIAWVPVV